MFEPLVFLPGLMCDARLYGPQIAHLSLDMPVMVAPITEGESIEGIVDVLLDQLPPRFALAGLSMGGIVAMEMLRRIPDRITRVALMDTNPLAEAPHIAAAREPQIVAAKTGHLCDVMRNEMKPNYLAPGPQKTAVLDLVMDMADGLGPDVFVRQSRALQRRPDQQATLRKCAHPALILCGAHDALCPVRRHELMADLMPNATLCVLEDSGHLPTLEQPVETNEALRAWMLQT